MHNKRKLEEILSNIRTNVKSYFVAHFYSKDNYEEMREHYINNKIETLLKSGLFHNDTFIDNSTDETYLEEHNIIDKLKSKYCLDKPEHELVSSIIVNELNTTYDLLSKDVYCSEQQRLESIINSVEPYLSQNEHHYRFEINNFTHTFIPNIYNKAYNNISNLVKKAMLE